MLWKYDRHCSRIFYTKLGVTYRAPAFAAEEAILLAVFDNIVLVGRYGNLKTINNIMKREIGIRTTIKLNVL